ncbi:hypothetical protein TNCV_297581 [Trichonephila clavipes]|nr:hypothetical protein TNCV_297581 [Trichonephila clavipes]
MWKLRSECLNPAFTFQTHIVPTAGVTVRDAISYNTRSPLKFHGKITAQRYVHGILQPHVLDMILTSHLSRSQCSVTHIKDVPRLPPPYNLPSLAFSIHIFLTNNYIWDQLRL